MKIVKWLGGILGFYVLFVVLFESVYLGWFQPSFDAGGLPMLKLTTTDDSGQRRDRMLAGFATDGHMYVSAHHWPRGWHRRAIANPDVSVEIDGVPGDYRAVPVAGAEFERVASTYPLPLVVRFLMGFPPEREILRLDPR